MRVKGIGKSYGDLGESVHAEHARLQKDGFKEAAALKSANKKSVYFEGLGRSDIPVIPLGDLHAGEKVAGPAILIDGTQTITLGE